MSIDCGDLYHVVGPPGTGKTEYLTRQAEAAAKKYGPAGVMVASLTKAAATEIASRCGDVDRDRIGTLHSLCYRATGGRRMVLDSPKGIREWNEWCRERGLSLALSGAAVDPDDPVDFDPGGTEGDRLIEQMNILRHQMIGPENWPDGVREFAREWSDCALELGATDFTAMIEDGLALAEAPGNPGVIIADEVQDFSRLETTVLRRWTAGAASAVWAGDENQAIYDWRTGGGRVFSDAPVATDHLRVLGQSYRVPRAVHAVARKIALRIPGAVDFQYAPTSSEGSVSWECRGAATHERPGTWAGMVQDAVAAAERDGVTDPRRGVMVIAPCSYMLDPLLAWLRREGVPYANRYRTKAGNWNPLGNVGHGKMTAAEQLAAFMGRDQREPWTWAALKMWVPLLRSRDGGALAIGAKARVERADGVRPTQQEWEALWSDPEDGRQASLGNVEWLMSACLPEHRRRLAYPLALARTRGVDALRRQPILTVGTIHSVKGGEAADVFLLNSMPKRWADGAQTDAPELLRMMYVGATRASRSLSILGTGMPL